MSRTVLGISWLHGQFRAVVLTGSSVSAAWTRPLAVLHDADFAPALAEAVRETRFAGTRVVIALEHRSLLFHVQETPPAKGAMLRQLLDRLVKQNRFFEENAAWGHVALPSGKGRPRYLLALLPESLVQQLTEACAGQHLQLTAVLPLAAVLGSQLRQLPVPPEEIVVLAADLGGALHLLLGRGDGQVLFSRSVVLTGAPQNERAAQEINRTLHYAQQQFGASVHQLFVFGKQAFAALKDLDIRHGLKVQQSPAAEDPFFYNREAAALSPKLSLNLVTRARPGQRPVRQWAAAGITALFLGAAATTLQVELVVHARERQAWVRARQQEAEASAQAAALTAQREERRLQAFLNLVGGLDEPPVPELFARYLATAIPKP
ncbi:MAG TPA: hypothetical protein VEO53_17155, partial [Candidatus Binatia bacterium]|nr:hypothetical protein [Candidatus Binatia bacterium]